MRQLLFAEGLYDEVLAGRKTVTIRRYRRGNHEFLRDHKIRAVFQMPDGSERKVTLVATAHTELKPFNKLTDVDARAAGFSDRREAYRLLKKWHPEIKPTDTMAVIRFRVARLRRNVNGNENGVTEASSDGTPQ